MKPYKVVLIIVALIVSTILADETSQQQQQIQGKVNTDIAEELDGRLLLFATLDGTLVAVDQQNGQIKWKIKDKPIVQVPLETSDAIVPLFLPDPRDGSLYLMGSNREPLKKLPFTIPQLVSSSPCRSSDGILYTGRKKDTWYKLDPRNGNKQQVLGWDITTSTCPLETNQFIYIGRTKYNIMMVDSHNPQRKWNVTYYDYTATPMTKDEKSNYDFVHFTSTSSGRLITVDRRRGNLVWDGDLNSPVVAVYLLDNEGLISVPFTSLSNHTLHYMSNNLLSADGSFQHNQNLKFYPTLYVGEHLFGLYALPSLVDQNVVTITSSENGPLLLDGPNNPEWPRPYPEHPIPGRNYRLPDSLNNDDIYNLKNIPNFGNHIIYIGHYNVPQYAKNAHFSISGRMQNKLPLITDESITPIREKGNSIGVQTDEKVLPKKAQSFREYLKFNYESIKSWINHQENKGMKLTLIILAGSVIAMFWYLQVQVREMQNMSQNGSNSSQRTGSTNGRHGVVTALPEELPDGLVKVGKITFHPEQLLGKGCEGTFVYRGEFDNRRVAVKRLLPECFTFADREVALLRESDAHPNVIRYYCTEQDRMFRYIALELCQATLSEYIQGKCYSLQIQPLEILRQATAGLSHLHSLDIVHRDIKPHNVLLSVPDSRGVVRAMISDFGLCKKLQVGRVSFSRRSGVTGTDGWIAPEMLNGTQRTTSAVDLFSLGCLYYYILSNGAHPFGDTLRRQANILSGEFNLKDLKGPDWQVNLEKPLISALISSNPARRPSCNAVLAHPLFWDSAKILAFFQDVSDRVEKAEVDDIVLQTLEDNAIPVVKSDWRVHIHEEVAKDLRKYRTYTGQSVRDLLRALRNKKHHFRELTREAQEYLGEIPEAFTNYWTSRFPLLLVHSWITMQIVSREDTFKYYYYDNTHYSVEDFYDQVREYMEENPVELPEDLNMDYFEKKKCDLEGESKGFYYSNRYGSPNKRQRNKITFADQKSPRKGEQQATGLYRNFRSSSVADPVDVSDVQLTYKKSYPQKRFQKRKKPADEPLTWVIKDNN